ncbi:MAG: hypothetical protein AAB250_11355, partial [Bdellovibrionota bacterium]
MSTFDQIDGTAIDALAVVAGTKPGSTLLEEVVAAYMKATPPLFDVMRSSQETGDVDALRRAAHA